MILCAITAFLTTVGNKNFLLKNARTYIVVLPMLHKCIRIVAPVMGQNNPQWSNLSGLIIASLKLCNIKINNSVKNEFYKYSFIAYS